MACPGIDRRQYSRLRRQQNSPAAVRRLVKSNILRSSNKSLSPGDKKNQGDKTNQ